MGNTTTKLDILLPTRLQNSPLETSRQSTSTSKPQSLRTSVSKCVTEKGGIDYAQLCRVKKTLKCNVAMVGPPRSGKSTLIRKLCGIEEYPFSFPFLIFCLYHRK
jgi:ribosome biogenesis GTPase A